MNELTPPVPAVQANRTAGYLLKRCRTDPASHSGITSSDDKAKQTTHTGSKDERILRENFCGPERAADSRNTFIGIYNDSTLHLGWIDDAADDKTGEKALPACTILELATPDCATGFKSANGQAMPQLLRNNAT